MLNNKINTKEIVSKHEKNMKFLIIDDHLIVALGLKILLEKNYKSSQSENTVDPEEGYNLAINKNYDLIFLDVNLPGANAMNIIANILRNKPKSRILVFSMNPDEIFAKLFIRKGAMGYINKESTDAEILKAVNCIMSGKRYLSKKLLQKISDDIFEKRTDNPFDKLSEREMDICAYLIKGFSISEISDVIQLHTSTIGTYKSRILEKTGAHNLLDLRDLAKEFNIPTYT